MSKSLRFVLAAALFGAAAFILVAAGLPDRAALTGNFSADGMIYAAEVGAFAPPFTTVTVSGDRFDLRTLRGSPVVLNFWATWCVPCAVEMPELESFSRTYPHVRVIGVNLGEPPEIITRWMDAGGFTFPVVLDSDGAISRLYALRGQPTTVILSSEGIIEHIFFGATTRTALESALRLVSG